MRTSEGSKCTMDRRKEGRRKLGNGQEGQQEELVSGQES
jgi:hypothetical protein